MKLAEKIDKQSLIKGIQKKELIVDIFVEGKNYLRKD